MPLEGICFVKALATFGIINATDSLIQNITRRFVSIDSSLIF